MIASLTFDVDSDTVFGNAGDLSSSTNLRGLFGPGVSDQLAATPTSREAFDRFLIASGTSSLTGFRYSMLQSVGGIRVVSPVTALLIDTDDNTTAARLALGMTGRELTTFDAFAALESSDPDVRARARAVTALNLKTLVYYGIRSADKGFATSAFQINPSVQFMRELTQVGVLDLNSAAQWEQLLRGTTDVFPSSPNVAAATALMARFGRAIDQHLTTQRSVADIEYAARLLILPEIERLMENRVNGAADLARINAFDVPAIVAALQQFSAIPLAPQSATALMAVADYREVTLALELPSGCRIGTELNCNDGFVSPFTAFDSDDLRIENIRIPSQFAAVATLETSAAGLPQVRRIGFDRQFIWIAYDAVAPNGARGTGRVYVLFPALN